MGGCARADRNHVLPSNHHPPHKRWMTMTVTSKCAGNIHRVFHGTHTQQRMHAEPTRKTTPHAHPFVRANTRSRAHLQSAHPRAHPPTCTHADAHPPDELVVGQPTRSAVPSLAPHPRLARTVLARYCVAPPALILTRIEVFCFRSTIVWRHRRFSIPVVPWYSKYQVYVHVYQWYSS